MNKSPIDDPRHRTSEEAAIRAEAAWSRGNLAEARQLFAEAAKLEEVVAREANPTLVRVRSVLAISAVALWYKSGAYGDAKRVAYQFLAGEGLADGAPEELEELVDRCSREAEMAKVTADPGMVPVEIKMRGGHVGVGIAPAAAARKRRERTAQLLVRVAELEANQPYRERGESELDRSDEIQIFEAPARAASYGLRFYVSSGSDQMRLNTSPVTPAKVVERFLTLASAAIEGPDALRASGALQAAREEDQERYAELVIDAFRDIAPDGDDVLEVVCSSPTWKLRDAPRLVFEPRHRTALSSGKREAQPREARAGEKIVGGKLVGVSIKTGTQWIDVDTGQVDAEGKPEPHFVLMPDARAASKLGPLINSEIRLIVRWAPKARRDVFIALA